MLEVVVVMTILLVLAAIVFPVFTRSKERAKETVCVSNIRQLLAAVELYANDNDGSYPWVSSASSRAIVKYTGGTELKCSIRLGERMEQGDYRITAARHPDPNFYSRAPDPGFPVKFDACRSKRAGAFPFVTDSNHVRKVQEIAAGRSALFIGRADGSVSVVLDPMRRVESEPSSLPCDPSLFFLNL